MPFEIKTGDRRPFFVVILKDDFGEVTESTVDLTSASSAVFNMWDHDTQAVKISRGGGTITNRVGGEVTYQWGTADLDTAGVYDMECEIGWNDGKPETFPSGPAGGTYWTVIVTQDIA